MFGFCYTVINSATRDIYFNFIIFLSFFYQITDADIVKEAKPSDYLEKVLPLLLRNGVVHFLGFGNRLGFDPVPSQLQVKKFLRRFKNCIHLLGLQIFNVNTLPPNVFHVLLFFQDIPITHILGEGFLQTASIKIKCRNCPLNTLKTVKEMVQIT